MEFVQSRERVTTKSLDKINAFHLCYMMTYFKLSIGKLSKQLTVFLWCQCGLFSHTLLDVVPVPRFEVFWALKFSRLGPNSLQPDWRVL